jgi:hypothetical protein
MAKYKRSSSQLLAVVLIGLGILTMAGCSTSCYVRSKSSDAIRSMAGSQPESFQLTSPSIGSRRCLREFPWPDQGTTWQLSKRFHELAKLLSDADDPRSTDYYFQAAVLSWYAMTEAAHGNKVEPCDWTTYHTSLAGLITEATRFGRIDCGHLRIYQPAGPRYISLVSSGLPVPINELSNLQLVTNTRHRKLKHYYSSPGLGLPVVALRKRPQIAGPEAERHAAESLAAASSVEERTVEQYLPPCLPTATST